MAQPTEKPRWADVGGDIIEPNTGKKDVGFVGGERPLAQFLNWLFNLIYLWILWLISLTQETLTLHSALGQAVNCDFKNINGGYWEVTGAPGEVRIPIESKLGYKITSWSVYIKDTVSVVDADLNKSSMPGGAEVKIGSTVISAANSTDQTLSHTLVTAETMVVGTAYYIKVTMPSNTQRVYGMTVNREAI